MFDNQNSLVEMKMIIKVELNLYNSNPSDYAHYYFSKACNVVSLKTICEF